MALTQEEIEELARILDARSDPLTQRREWLADNRPSRPRRGRRKSPPKLSIVAAEARIPAPPGFEEYAISRLSHWKPTGDRKELENRFSRLWNLWLGFLGSRCSFRDSDPGWQLRYDAPDVRDLVERIPELIAQRRRRFGTAYCRLVRENGRPVNGGAA